LVEQSFRIKKKFFANRRFACVAISDAMLHDLSKSSIGLMAAVRRTIHYPCPRPSAHALPHYDQKRRAKIRILAGAQNLKNKRKGFHLLIEAFQKIRLGLSAELVCFGAQSESLSAVEGVTQVGYVRDASQLRSLYESADVFCIPSLEEGFGLTGVEALSNGCPIVCLPGTGPTDYVISGATGMVAEAKTADSLAIALQKTVEMRADLSSQVVRNNYTQIWESHLTPTVCARAYLEVYRNL
jgi:glycosyltransferase involved in cell wall biosynthesis